MKYVLDWGELARRLEQTGRPLAALDSLIAAIALDGGYTIATATRTTSPGQVLLLSIPGTSCRQLRGTTCLWPNPFSNLRTSSTRTGAMDSFLRQRSGWVLDQDLLAFSQ
jgi:hypothetical protein